jgi:cell division protein FtsB
MNTKLFEYKNMQNKDKRTTVTLSSKVYLELDALKYELKKQEGNASMDSTVLTLLEDRKTLKALEGNTDIPLKNQDSTPQESIEIERLKKALLNVLTFLENRNTLSAVNSDNSEKLSQMEFQNVQQTLEIQRLNRELRIKQTEIENLKEGNEVERKNLSKKEILSMYKSWKGSRSKFLEMINPDHYLFNNETHFIMINPALFIVLNSGRLLGGSLTYNEAKKYICDLISEKPTFKFFLEKSKDDFEL